MSLSTPIVLHWIEKTLFNFITDICSEHIEQINSEETAKEISKFTKPRLSGVLIVQLSNERLRQGPWDDRPFHFTFVKGETFLKQTLTIYHKNEVKPLSVVFVKTPISDETKIDSISHYSCYTYHDMISVFTEYIITDILVVEMNKYSSQEKLHVEWFQTFINQFNAAIASTVNLSVPAEFETALTNYLYFKSSNNTRTSTDESILSASIKIVNGWTSTLRQVINAKMRRTGELTYPEVESDSSIKLPEFDPVIHFLQKWKIYSTMLHILNDQINDKGKKQILHIVARANIKENTCYQDWKDGETDLKSRLTELRHFIIPLSELEYPILLTVTKPAKIPYAKVGEMLNTKQIPNAYSVSLIKDAIPFFFSTIDKLINEQSNGKILGYIVPIANECIQTMITNVDLDMENSVVALKKLLEDHNFTNRTNIMDLADNTAVISYKQPNKDLVYQEAVTSSFVSEISAVELLKVILKFALYNFDVSNFITKNGVTSTKKVDLQSLKIPTQNNFVDISSINYTNKIEKCFAYNSNVFLGAFFVRVLNIVELRMLLLDKCAMLVERFPRQANDIFGPKLSILKSKFDQFNKISAIERLFKEIIILQLIERIESSDRSSRSDSNPSTDIVDKLFKDLAFSESFHVHSFFKILQTDFEVGVTMLIDKIKTIEMNIINLIHGKFGVYLNVDYDIALKILERIMLIAGENLKKIFADSIHDIIKINISNLEATRIKFTILKKELQSKDLIGTKHPIIPMMDALDHMLKYVSSKTKPILRLNLISEEYLSSVEGTTMTKIYYDLKKGINEVKVKLVEAWLQTLVYVNIDTTPLLRTRNKKIPIIQTNNNEEKENEGKKQPGPATKGDDTQANKVNQVALTNIPNENSMFNIWDIDYEINVPKDYILILDQLCKLKERKVKLPRSIHVTKEKLLKSKRFIGTLEQLLTIRAVLIQKFHEIKPFQIYFIPQIIAVESSISPLLTSVTWNYGSIRLVFKMLLEQMINGIRMIEYFLVNVHLNYVKLFSVTLRDMSDTISYCFFNTLATESNLTGALNINTVPVFVNSFVKIVNSQKEAANNEIIKGSFRFAKKLESVVREYLRYVFVILDEREFKVVVYKTYKSAGKQNEMVTDLAHAKREILADPSMSSIATVYITNSLVLNLSNIVKAICRDLLNIIIVKMIKNFTTMLIDGFLNKSSVFFEIEMVPSFPRAIYNTHPKKFLVKLCKSVVKGFDHLGTIRIPGNNTLISTQNMMVSSDLELSTTVKGFTPNSYGARAILRYACAASVAYELFKGHFDAVVMRVSNDIYNLNEELKRYLEMSTAQIIKILIKSKEESDRRHQAIIDRKRRKREEKLLRRKMKSRKPRGEETSKTSKNVKDADEETDSVDGFLLALEEQLVDLENMAKKKIEIQKTQNIIELTPYNISLNSTNRELFIETHKAMSKLSDIMGLGIKGIIYEQKSKIQMMVKTLISVDISMQNKLTNDEQILKYLNPKIIGRINQKLQEATDEIDLLVRLKNIALEGLRIFINKRGVNPILDKDSEDGLSFSSINVSIDTITEIANKSGSLTHYHIKEIDKMIDLIKSTLANRKTDFSEIMTKFKIAYSNFSSKISQDIVDINDNLNKNGLANQISFVLRDCEQASIDKSVFSYSVMIEYLRNQTIRQRFIYAIKNSSRRLESFKNLSKPFIERCSFIKSIATSANIKISLILSTVEKYKRLTFYTEKLVEKLEAITFLLNDVLNLKWNSFLGYVQLNTSGIIEDNCYRKLKSFLERKVMKFTAMLERSGITGLNRVITFFTEANTYLEQYFFRSLETCIALDLHQTHWIYLSSLCVGNILPPPAQTILKDFTVIDFFKIKENLKTTFDSIRYTQRLGNKITNITSVFDRSVLFIDTIPTQFLPHWIGRNLNAKVITVPLYLKCRGEPLLKELTNVIQKLKSLELKSHYEINVETEGGRKLNKVIDSLIKTKTVVINVAKFQTFVLYAFMLIIQSKVDFEARYSQYFGSDIASSTFVTVDPSCDFRSVRFPMKRPINFKEMQGLLNFNPNIINSTTTTTNLIDMMGNNSLFRCSHTDETDIGDTDLLQAETEQLTNMQNHIEHLFSLTDIEKYELVDMFPEGRWVPRKRALKLIQMWNSLMLSIRDVNSNSAFIDKIDVFESKLHDVMNYHKVFFDDVEKQYIIFQRKMCPYLAKLSSPDILNLLVTPTLPTNVPRLQWSQKLLNASPYGYVSGNLQEFNTSDHNLNMAMIKENDEVNEIKEVVENEECDEAESNETLLLDAQFRRERDNMVLEGARIINECVPGIYSFVFSPDDRYLTGVIFGSGYKPGCVYTIEQMPKVLVFTRPIQVGLETTSTDRICAHISPSIWLPTAVLEMQCSIKNSFFKLLKSFGFQNLHISTVKEKSIAFKINADKREDEIQSSSQRSYKGDSISKGGYQSGTTSPDYEYTYTSPQSSGQGFQKQGHGAYNKGGASEKGKQNAKDAQVIEGQDLPLMFKNLLPVETCSLADLKGIVDLIPMNILVPFIICLHTYQFAAAVIAPQSQRKQMFARYFRTIEELKTIFREMVLTTSHIYIEAAALTDYFLTFTMHLLTKKNTSAKIRSAFDQYRKSLNINYKVFEEDPNNEYLGYLRFIYDVELAAKFLTVSSNSSFISFDGNLPAIFGFVKENINYARDIPVSRLEAEDLAYYGIKERNSPTIDFEELNLFSNPKIFQRINRVLYRSANETSRGSVSGLGSLASSKSSVLGSASSIGPPSAKHKSKLESQRSSRLMTARTTRSSRTARSSTSSRIYSSRLSSSHLSGFSTGRAGLSSSEDYDLTNEKLSILFKRSYEMLKKLATMGWPSRTIPMSNGFLYVPHILESYVTMANFFVRVGSSPHLYSFTAVKNDAWIVQGGEHSIIPRIFSPDIVCALKSINEGGFAAIPYFTAPLLSCPESTTTRISELYAMILGRFSFNISNVTLTKCKETFNDILGSVPFLQRRSVKEERSFEDMYCNPLYLQLSLYETLPCITQVSLEAIPSSVQMALGYHISDLEIKLESPIQLPTVTSMKSTYYPEDYQYTPYTINKSYIPIFSKNISRFKIVSQLDYKLSYIEPQNIDNITYSTYYSRGGSISPLYQSMSATGDAINMSVNPSKFNMRGSNNMKYFSETAKSFNALYNTGTTPGKPLYSLNSMNTTNMINRERSLMTAHVLCILRSYPYVFGNNFLNESNYLHTISFRLSSLLHMIGLRYDEKENFINYFDEHLICSVVRSYYQNLVAFYSSGTTKVSHIQLFIYSVFISLFFGLQTIVPYSKRVRSRTLIAIPTRSYQLQQIDLQQQGAAQYGQKVKEVQQVNKGDYNGPSGFYALSNSMTFLEGLDEKFQRLLCSEMTCCLKITEPEPCNPLSRLNPENLINKDFMPSSSQSLGENCDIMSYYKQSLSNLTLMHPMLAQVICHVPTEQKELEIEKKYNETEHEKKAESSTRNDIKRFKLDEMTEQARQVLDIFGDIKSTIDLQIFGLFDFAKQAIAECPTLLDTKKDHCLFLMERYNITDVVAVKLIHFMVKIILIVGCKTVNSSCVFLFKIGIQMRESMTIFCEANSSTDISAALVIFALALATNLHDPYYSSAIEMKTKWESYGEGKCETDLQDPPTIGYLPTPLFVFDGMVIKPVSPVLLHESLRDCKFTSDVMLINMTTEKSSVDFENSLRKYAGNQIMALKFRNATKLKRPCMISNALYYTEWRQELHGVYLADPTEAYPCCLPLSQKYRFVNPFTTKVWQLIVFPTMSYMLNDSFLWNGRNSPLITNPHSNTFMKMISRNIASTIFRYALSHTYLFKEAIVNEPFGTSKERVLIKVLGSPLLRQYLTIIITESVLLTLVNAFQPPFDILKNTKEFLEVYLKVSGASTLFEPLEDDCFTHFYNLLDSMDINDDNCDSGKFNTLFTWRYMTNSVISTSPTYYEILTSSFHSSVISFFDIPEYTNSVVFNSILTRIPHGMKNEFTKIYESITANNQQKRTNFLTKNIITYYVLHDKGLKTTSEFVKNTVNELINIIYENMDDIIKDSKMVLMIDTMDIDVLNIPVINNIVDAVSSISSLMNISTTIMFLVADNTLNIGSDIFPQTTQTHFAELHAKAMSKMLRGAPFGEIHYHLDDFVLYDCPSVESLGSPITEGYYGITSIPFIKDSIMVWKQISLSGLLKVLKFNKMTLTDLDIHIDESEIGDGKKRQNLDVQFDDIEFPYDYLVCRLMDSYPNIKGELIHYFVSSVLLHTSYILSEYSFLPPSIYDTANRKVKIVNGVYISSGFLFIDSLLAGFGRAAKVSPFSKIGLYEIDISPDVFVNAIYEINRIPPNERPQIASIVESPMIHGIAFLRPESPWGQVFVNGYAYGSEVGIPEMYLIFPKQARIVLALSQYISIYMRFPENTTIPYLLTHENSFETNYVISAALKIAFGSSKHIDFNISDTQLESGMMLENIGQLFLQLATTRAIDGVEDEMMGWDDPQVVLFKLPKMSSPERNIGPVSTFLKYYVNMPFAQLAYSITREDLNILVQRHNSTVITAPIPTKNNASILTKFIYHRIIPIIVMGQTVPGCCVYDDITQKYITTNGMNSLFLMSPVTSTCLKIILDKTITNVVAEIQENIDKAVIIFMNVKDSDYYTLFDGVTPRKLMEKLLERYRAFKEEDLLLVIKKLVRLILDLEQSRHSFNYKDDSKERYVAVASLGVDSPLHLCYHNDILDDPLLPADIGFTVEHSFFSERPGKISYDESGNLELILSAIEQFKHIFYRVFSVISRQLENQMMFMEHSIAVGMYIKYLENLREENYNKFVDFDKNGKDLFKEYVEINSRIMKSEEFVRKLGTKVLNMEQKVKDITKVLQNDNSTANQAYCSELHESTCNLLDQTEESEILNIIPLLSYLNDCLRILNGEKLGPSDAKFENLASFDSPTLMFEETSIPIPTQNIESFNYQEMQRLYKKGQFNFVCEARELVLPYTENILFKEVLDYNPQYGNEIMEFRDPILLARDIAKWINVVIHTQSLSSTSLIKQNEFLTGKIRRYKTKMTELMQEIDDDREKADKLYEEHDNCIRESMKHHKLVSSISKSLVELKLMHEQIQRQVLPEKYRKMYSIINYNIIEYVLSLSIEFHMPKLYILHEQTIMENLWNMDPYGTVEGSELPTIEGTETVMELQPLYITRMEPSYFFYTNSPFLKLKAAGAVSSVEMRMLSLCVYTPLTPIVFDNQDIFGPLIFGYYPTAEYYSSVEGFLTKVVGSTIVDDLKSREISTFPAQTIMQITINDLYGSSPYAAQFSELCNIYRKAWPDGPKIFLICRQGHPSKSIKNFSYISYPVSAESIAFRLSYFITTKKAAKFQKEVEKIVNRSETVSQKTNNLITSLNAVKDVLAKNNNFVFNADVISELTKLRNKSYNIAKLAKEQMSQYGKACDVLDLLHENKRSFLLTSYVVLASMQIKNNINSAQFVSSVLSDDFSLEPMWSVDIPSLVTMLEMHSSSTLCRSQVQSKQGVANQNLKNHMFFKENSDTSLLNARFTFWNTSSKMSNYHKFQLGLLFTLEAAATSEIITLLYLIIGSQNFMEQSVDTDNLTEKDIYNCLINMFSSTSEDKRLLNGILKHYYENNAEDSSIAQYMNRYGGIIKSIVEGKKILNANNVAKVSIFDMVDTNTVINEEQGPGTSTSIPSGQGKFEDLLMKDNKLYKLFGNQPYDLLLCSELFRDLDIKFDGDKMTDEDVAVWIDWANEPNVLGDEGFPTKTTVLSKNDERYKKLHHDTMLYWAKFLLCVMINPSRLLEMILKLMKVATKGVVNLVDMGFIHHSKTDDFEPLSTDSQFLSTIPSTLSLMTNSDDIFQLPSTINLSALENSCNFLKMFEPSSFLPVPRYEHAILLNISDKETVVYQRLCELVQKPILLVLLLPSCPLHLFNTIGVASFTAVHEDNSNTCFTVNTIPWWIPLASFDLQNQVLSRVISRGGSVHAEGYKTGGGIKKKNPLNVHKDFRLGYIQQSNHLCETCANTNIVGLAWLEALGKTCGDILGKVLGRRVINLTHSHVCSSNVISENSVDKIIVPVKTNGINSAVFDGFVWVSSLCVGDKAKEITGSSIERGYRAHRLDKLNERLRQMAMRFDGADLQTLFEDGKTDDTPVLQGGKRNVLNTQRDQQFMPVGEQHAERKELVGVTEYILLASESTNEKYKDSDTKYGFNKKQVKVQFSHYSQPTPWNNPVENNDETTNKSKKLKYSLDQIILPLMFSAAYTMAMLSSSRNLNNDVISETTVTLAGSLKIYSHIILCSSCPKGKIGGPSDAKTKANKGVGLIPWISSAIVNNIVTLDACDKDQLKGEVIRVFSYVLEKIVRKYEKRKRPNKESTKEGKDIALPPRDMTVASIIESTGNLIKSFMKNDLQKLFRIPFDASFGNALECIKTYSNCYGISHKELYSGCPLTKTYNRKGNLQFTNNIKLVYDSMIQNLIHFKDLEDLMALVLKREFKFSPLSISTQRKSLPKLSNSNSNAPGYRTSNIRRSQPQTNLAITDDLAGLASQKIVPSLNTKMINNRSKVLSKRKSDVTGGGVGGESGGLSNMTLGQNESVEGEANTITVFETTVSYEQQASARCDVTTCASARQEVKNENAIDVIIPNGSFFMYCYYSTIYTIMSAFSISRTKMLASTLSVTMMDKNNVYSTITPTPGGAVTGANDVFKTKGVMNHFRTLTQSQQSQQFSPQGASGTKLADVPQGHKESGPAPASVQIIPVEQMYIGNLIYELSQQYLKIVQRIEQTDPTLDITNHIDKINANFCSTNIIKLPIGTNSGPIDGTSSYNLKKKSLLQTSQNMSQSILNGSAPSLHDIVIPDNLDFSYKLPPYILPVEQITHYSNIPGNKVQNLPIYSSQSGCSILYPLMSFLNNSVFYFRNALFELRTDLKKIAELFSPVPFSNQKSTNEDFARGVEILVDKVPEKWRYLFMLPNEYDNKVTVSSISCNKFFRYSLPSKTQSLWKLFELVVHCVSMISSAQTQATSSNESTALAEHIMRYRNSDITSGSARPNIAIQVQNCVNYEMLMKPIFDNFTFLLSHLPFRRYFEVSFIETLQRTQGMIDTVHRNRMCLTWDLQHVSRSIAHGVITPEQETLLTTDALDSGAMNGVPPILCEKTTFAYLPLSSISLGYIATDVSMIDRFQMFTHRCRSLESHKSVKMAQMYERYQRMAVAMSFSFCPTYDMLYESVGWKKIVELALDSDKAASLIQGNHSSVTSQGSLYFSSSDTTTISNFKTCLFNEEGLFIAVVAASSSLHPFPAGSLTTDPVSINMDGDQDAAFTPKDPGEQMKRFSKIVQRGKDIQTSAQAIIADQSSTTLTNQTPRSQAAAGKIRKPGDGALVPVSGSEPPVRFFNMAAPPNGRIQVAIQSENDVLRVIGCSRMTQLPYRFFLSL